MLILSTATLLDENGCHMDNYGAWHPFSGKVDIAVDFGEQVGELSEDSISTRHNQGQRMGQGHLQQTARTHWPYH